MDLQTGFNIAVGIAGFLGAYVFHTITGKQKEDGIKIAELELMVAGQYVTKPDLEKFSNAVFNKLDKIETKLDNKADK